MRYLSGLLATLLIAWALQVVLISGALAAPGTVSNAGVWTGLMENGQCTQIAQVNTITGDFGETATATVFIESSVLQGSVANVDPNVGNNTYDITPLVLAPLPDYSISTRLLTPGEIVNGTDITYEVVMSNIGAGSSLSGFQPTLFFIIPPDATYNSVLDLDLGDSVSIDSCVAGPPGDIVPGLGAYYSGTAVLCFTTLATDFDPGMSSVFTFSLTASASFVSGSTEVIAAVGGDDIDTMGIQIALSTGGDPFDTSVNSVVHLTYNTTELQTTVARCPGQGAVTTNGTGCFRVSFNKLIYAPGFTSNDIVLTGGGSVSSFTKLDDYTWEVHISGIPLGATTTLTLAEDSVQDYSAVMNSVQVLGENTIRYEVESADAASETNSASGTLANTGSELDWKIPFAMLLLGFAMLFVSHKKEFSSVH